MTRRPAPRLDAAFFDQVATRCRWSERSLGVARAILVDGQEATEAATVYQMTNNQAHILKNRFIKLAEKFREETFKQFIEVEKPKGEFDAIQQYETEILALRDKGYSVQQIASYLKRNGIKETQAIIEKFIRSIRA